MTSLDSEQRQAVQSEAPTLRVLAGAGSGKTRVLTQRVARRLADGSAESNHTLVLTFTRKAADELRGRLGQLTDQYDIAVVTGTFHAVAYAQLRQRWIESGRVVPAVISQPTRVLNAVLEKLRLNRLANPRSIAAELSWAKSNQLRPVNYCDGLARHGHRPPVSATQMLKIYEVYEAEKKKRRIIDYDDLLLMMTDALRTDYSFAVSQRWQFRHFFVDEFQDLNAAQFSLLRAWMGDGKDLFVVGDPNQAIYGWNGADSSYLNSLEHYFPEVKTISLRTNYRSSKSVLAAAHSLISDAAVTPESAMPGQPPVIREFVDDGAEADGIALSVRETHHRNFRWSDIAVLVRTNAQRGVIEAAFDKYSIPYRSAGGASWLYEAEVRNALEYLRDSMTTPLVQRAPDIEEMIDEIGEKPGGYLHQLQASIHSCLLTDPGMTVGDFLSWVEVGSRQDSPSVAESGAAVTITTFHRAKGLEWPVVFLAGIEDGLVPIANADAEEERRLFYVAVTRAREEVHCSWAKQRSNGTTSQDRVVSPWLNNVATSSRPPALASPESLHQAIDHGRQALHLASVSIPAREALIKWRASRAKLTGVDARLILDDHVIDVIVESCPRSRKDLAQIDGFGPVRAANIGDELIQLIQAGGSGE